MAAIKPMPVGTEFPPGHSLSDWAAAREGGQELWSHIC